MTVNRYTKLIKTLKESPTNSMGGVYSLNPQGFDLRKADVAKKFYPGIDGNFPNGIPGSEGDPFYLRPAGFWDGGDDWESYEVSDGSQDYLLEDPTGKSTSGLIADDGSVKAALPPNSRHFILGPLVDGYVPNHGYDNFTNIGYLQKDTRQFVLLARIQGQFTADLHSEGARVWDGTEGQLTIINSNFTLEMAEWFRDQITAGSFTPNVPYFYSGGVPQEPQTPAQCPNCPPNMFGGVGPGTNRQFGTGKLPTLGTQYTNPTPDSGDQLKANIFNLTPDQQRTVMNAVMLGLDIVAVVALLFPEPGSSAAGAAHLATKFRYVAKLRMARGALNPFGQRAVRSGAAGRVRRQVYSGRPYQGKRGFGKTTYGTTNRATARTYSNPGPLKGTPGTGSRVNPRGTVDRGTLPQRYIDKYGSRSVLGQKQIKLGPKAAKRTFGEAFGFILETATAVPSLGTEVADAYVNTVTQDASPEELEQASNDANDIATKGGQGLSDSDLEKIDNQAEKDARELNNVDHSRPENMTRDQIHNFYDMAASVDPEWLEQNFNKYEGLIDTNAYEKAYEEYDAQTDYLSSEEYYGTFAGYNQYKNESDSLWPSVQGHTETKYNKRYEGGKLVGWATAVYKNGVRLSWEASKSFWDNRKKWYRAYTEYYRIFYDVVLPAKKIALEKAFNTYSSAVSKAFRSFDMAIIRAWSQRNVNDDPFSLEDLTAKDVSEMSEAEKEELKQWLMALGVSYGDIAYAAEGGSLTDPLMDLVIGTGVAILGALGTLYNMTNDQIQNMNQSAAGTLDSGDYDNPHTREQGERVDDQHGEAVRKGEARERGTSEAEKQEKSEAAQQLKDAEKEVKDAEASGNKDRIDRAYDNYGKARDNSTRVRNKWKENRKNQKESYKPQYDTYDPPKFLKRRERKELTENKNSNQRRILREIRQPVEIKKAPSKYKINFTNNNTFSSQTDELVSKANARGQQWRDENKRWSGYETTEKDNIIQDRVGHGKQAWEYMIEQGTQKSEWRTKEVQEELNKIAHEKAMLKENPDFKSPFGDVEVSTTEVHDDNFNKVSKKIKQIASKDKEVKPEYPDDGDELQKKDMLNTFEKLKKEFEHEKLNSGERASAYYKRLDPTSAKSMPDAAYPQIDAFKDQARKKPK